MTWRAISTRPYPWGATEPSGTGLKARGVNGGGGGGRGGRGASVAAHCPWHPGGVGPAGRQSPGCQVDAAGSSSPDASPARNVLTRTSPRVVVGVAARREGADAVVAIYTVVAAPGSSGYSFRGVFGEAFVAVDVACHALWKCGGRYGCTVGFPLLMSTRSSDELQSGTSQENPYSICPSHLHRKFTAHPPQSYTRNSLPPSAFGAAT